MASRVEENEGGSGRLAVPDVIHARPQRVNVRWPLMLTVLTRFVAALWILRALTEWAVILGLSPEGPGFEALARPVQSATVAFAVLHCIVAVGLWLSWSWGGVLWLMMIVLEVGLFFGLPALNLATPPLLIFFGIFVAIYTVMVFLERRENP